MSLPNTCTATIVSASLCVGLILPGMIDEPGSLSGIVISPKPARGPLAYRRTSLAIFIAMPPSVRSAALALTIASCADSAANLLRADVNGLPVACAMCRATTLAEARRRVDAGADRRAAERQRIAARRARWRRYFVASSSCATQPEITWPSVTGVASCRCVRPSMTTSANARALRVERRAQLRDRGQQRAVELLDRRDVHHRRETRRSTTGCD